MSGAPDSVRLPLGVTLLLLLLEPRHRDLFAGDLIEEYERFVVPTRSSGSARRWLWSHAFRGSLVGFAHRVFDLTAALGKIAVPACRSCVRNAGLATPEVKSRARREVR